VPAVQRTGDDVIADTAPRPGAFPRLYFLQAGKKHAPVAKWWFYDLELMSHEHGNLTMHDINVRINPDGEDWHEQQGRTVSFIVEWFERGARKFPNDADRYWYIWGFDAK